MANEHKGLSASGKLFLQLYNNSVLSDKVLGPYNVPTLTYDPGKPKEMIRESRQHDTLGQALDAFSVPGVPSLKLQLDDGDAQALRLVMLGDVSSLASAAGTVTAEAHTVSVGSWTKLVKRKVSSVVVKKGAAVLVSGTDYLLDASLGAVQMVVGGALTDGDAITVDYAYAAINGQQVIAGRVTNLRAKVILDGINMATRNNVFFEAPMVYLMPSKGLDIIGKDFASSELEGTIIRDTVNNLSATWSETV